MFVMQLSGRRYDDSRLSGIASQHIRHSLKTMSDPDRMNHVKIITDALAHILMVELVN
jgi:hypothetical protein